MTTSFEKTHHGAASRRWLWLLVLFTVAGLIETLFWGQVVAFTPLHLPVLGVAAADVPRMTAVVAAVGAGVGLPTLPLWGALAERYARKPVIVRSFALYFIGCIIIAFASGIYGLLIGRAVMGLSLGNSGLMMATLGERVPQRRRALAFAIFNTAPPLGAFLGPLAGGSMVDGHGVRALFALNAVIMLGVVGALAFGYRDTILPTSHRRVRDLALESLVILVSSARLRSLFASLTFLFSGWVLANLYLPLYLKAHFPCVAPATRVGWVLVAGGIGTVLLAPALGALADRKGIWLVLIAAALCQSAAWLLPAFAPSLGAFVAAWSVANGLASACFALAFTALSDSAPSDARARVMAFAYLPSTVGQVIAAGIGGVLGGAFERTIFPVSALLTFVGVLGLRYSRRS